MPEHLKIFKTKTFEIISLSENRENKTKIQTEKRMRVLYNLEIWKNGKLSYPKYYDG